MPSHQLPGPSGCSHWPLIGIGLLDPGKLGPQLAMHLLCLSGGTVRSRFSPEPSQEQQASGWALGPGLVKPASGHLCLDVPSHHPHLCPQFSAKVSTVSQWSEWPSHLWRQVGLQPAKQASQSSSSHHCPRAPLVRGSVYERNANIVLLLEEEEEKKPLSHFWNIIILLCLDLVRPGCWGLA